MDENVTIKQFSIDIALIIAVSLLFASVFVYLIPAVAARSIDTEKMQNAARAQGYHQYLVRKGVL
jgi:hypothetical protein